MTALIENDSTFTWLVCGHLSRKSENLEKMNMQVLEERMIRSRSPKRYSLNRKIKEKELRKQINSFDHKASSSSPPKMSESNTSCQSKLQDREANKSEKTATNSTLSTQTLNTAREQKNNRRLAAKPVTGGNTASCSPSELQNITSHTSNNVPRMRLNNPYNNHAPYANLNPYYLNYSFHGVPAMPSQYAARAGAGPTHLPYVNPFMHCYLTPVQTPGGFHFRQINMHTDEACNAFTAYSNPYGVFWRQN